jgi:hypothetical protein
VYLLFFTFFFLYVLRFLLSMLIKFHGQYFCFTGQPSWGIAWYINDRLIPEVYVERGQTYAFIVEGGNDRTNPARYHPFYITDSSEGGFGQKSEAEQKRQRVFGGVNYDSEGYPYPTAGELLVRLRFSEHALNVKFTPVAVTVEGTNEGG